MKKILAYLLAIISFSVSAHAAYEVKPEPNIYQNVSIISADNLMNIIKDNLDEHDLSEKLNITLRTYNKGLKLNYKYDSYDVEVTDFNLNKRARRFRMKLAFRAGENYIENVIINGAYSEMVAVPVLRERLPYKTIISRDDLTFIDQPKHRLRHDTVFEMDQLIGKELKHSMMDLKPIRQRNIAKKKIVLRNNLVNIIYKTSFITLQTSGIAMDSGAKGDVIRVRNTDSNKVVQATIREDGSVVINSGQNS